MAPMAQAKAKDPALLWSALAKRTRWECAEDDGTEEGPDEVVHYSVSGSVAGSAGVGAGQTGGVMGGVMGGMPATMAAKKSWSVMPSRPGCRTLSP